MAVMRQNKQNSTLLGSERNGLVWLIIINAVVFVLINFIKIIFYLTESDIAGFYKGVLGWFLVPANIHTLATRPWTLLSYMFTHDSIWSLIGTVLWLWGFGYILQDLTGNRKIIPIYLYGGFAGAIFFIATQYSFPVLRANVDSIFPLIGAGSAVMAIAVATTTLAPTYRLLPMLNGGIPLWVLTLIFIAFDYATIASANAGTAIAHLAGAATGFVFIRQMEKGTDWSLWMNNLFDWVNNLFNPEKKYKKPTRNQIFYKATKKPYHKVSSRFSQQKLDEILDKINQDGYGSLSNDEKDYLKKASKEDL
ncbi:MAG: rhomboid family intramembrane serine protease [Bacteroidota bacterium]|nr:rhomboid family intramembrane serine protease [Bacteroidota bacterium]